MEGISPADDGNAREGRRCYGALAIGRLKTAVQRRCLTRLFERNDLLLDAEEIFDLARSVTLLGVDAAPPAPPSRPEPQPEPERPAPPEPRRPRRRPRRRRRSRGQPPSNRRPSQRRRNRRNRRTRRRQTRRSDRERAGADALAARRCSIGAGAPYIMGIVNVTPDSFSGDGLGDDPARAVAHGLALVRDGADLLDVGGESTRPGATPVTAEEEQRRILPVIERLAAEAGVPISVDTYRAATAAAALRAGATIVNDVWGLRHDPAMAQRRAPRPARRSSSCTTGRRRRW